MNKIKIIFNEHSEYLIDFLKGRINKLGNRQLKGTNEFETIWGVAETEGRKREMLDIIKDIETIISTKYERE